MEKIFFSCVLFQSEQYLNMFRSQGAKVNKGQKEVIAKQRDEILPLEGEQMFFPLSRH